MRIECTVTAITAFAAVLAAGEDEEMTHRLRRAETIGRPVGNAEFVDRLERISGRSLKPAKRGRKPAGNRE